MARTRPVDPRLLRAVPQARRSVVGLGVAGVLQGVATVCGAFAVGALVTAVVHQDDLVGPITLLALAFGARAALAYAVERTAARAGVTVSGALRARLLGTWLERPAETWPDPAAGTTLAAQGCTAVETYVTRYLPALVHASVVPVLAVGALFVVDWPSAVIVVLTLPLLPLFAALIGRTTQEATDRRWAALQGLSGHFVDVVRGLPTLVAYGRGTRQVATVRSVSERHREETMATLRLSFLSSAALELLATLSVALVAVTVGLRLAAGNLDLLPGLVAILLAPEAYWPIRRVGAEFHAAADGAQALDRIMDELDADAPVPTRIPGSGVVLQQVGYRYPGDDTEVLRDLTLTAGGGLTVVTGASGSGKTTLLELVAGLRTPTPERSTPAPAHLVTQRPFLLPGSVRDNLQLVAAEPVAPRPALGRAAPRRPRRGGRRDAQRAGHHARGRRVRAVRGAARPAGRGPRGPQRPPRRPARRAHRAPRRRRRGDHPRGHHRPSPPTGHGRSPRRTAPSSSPWPTGTSSSWI